MDDILEFLLWTVIIALVGVFWIGMVLIIAYFPLDLLDQWINQ